MRGRSRHAAASENWCRRHGPTRTNVERNREPVATRMRQEPTLSAAAVRTPPAIDRNLNSTRVHRSQRLRIRRNCRRSVFQRGTAAVTSGRELASTCPSSAFDSPHSRAKGWPATGGHAILGLHSVAHLDIGRKHASNCSRGKAYHARHQTDRTSTGSPVFAGREW